MPKAKSNKESALASSALESFAAADPLTLKLLDQARRVAAADSTVLISGESGTGKDLLASLIHYLGQNPEQPLIKIDCAGLPATLLESELFGFERGAFTGATQRKRGRLELAESGTAVLDEVATLTLGMQAKLLRVIEEKKFDRLGGTKPIPVKARLIALTNVELEGAVARKAFREDLFYRLSVVPLRVPPLRERPADIAVIAKKLLEQLGEKHNKPRIRLSVAALRALEQYAFPGNVREMRNILERAIVQGDGNEIGLDDLPASIRASQEKPKKRSLEELEKDYIAEILDHTRGKKSKAAEILGISRKNLLEKRKKYGL